MPSILSTKRVPALTYTGKRYLYNQGNKAWFVGTTSEYPTTSRFSLFLETPQFEFKAQSSIIDFVVNPNDGKLYCLKYIGTGHEEIQDIDGNTVGDVVFPTFPSTATSTYSWLNRPGWNKLAYFDGDKFCMIAPLEILNSGNYSYSCYAVYGKLSEKNIHAFSIGALPIAPFYTSKITSCDIDVMSVSNNGEHYVIRIIVKRRSAEYTLLCYANVLFTSERKAKRLHARDLTLYVNGFYGDGFVYYQTSANGAYQRLNLETGEVQANYFTPETVQYSTAQPIHSFGDTILFQTPNGIEQEVLTFEEYHLNYSFKDNDGNTIRDLTDKLPITKVNFQYVNEDATITLTYLDNSTETVNVTFPSLPNKQLYGLNVVPNAKTPLIVEGDNDFSTQENVTFYPVYKTYIPIGGDLQLDLYQCSAEANRVDKTNYISKIGTLKGAFREETDLLEIDVIIEQKNLPSFNYIYIPILNRWYFVDSIASVRSTLWRLSLSVDVLMTYKDGIRQLKAFVDRNENSSDNTIIDPKRVVQQGYDVETNVVENDLFSKSGIPYSYTVTGFALKDDSQSAQALAVDETKDGEENA